jgi:heme O synthase-like polyprenyltransferase
MNEIKAYLRGAWRSRLVWLNTVAAFAAALLADSAVREFVLSQIGPNGLATVAAAVAAGNIALRFATTKPLTER